MNRIYRHPLHPGSEKVKNKQYVRKQLLAFVCFATLIIHSNMSPGVFNVFLMY